MITFKVSEFVDYLREHLRTTVGEVTVQGEVSGFRDRGDNLVFFDLKDDSSVISCFMMKYELTQPIEDGLEIRVLAVPSLFKKSGKLHLRVKEVELVGEGALRQALLKLQAKLQKEGLLAEERKRPLPKFPERIGLITSADAAAYTDVLKALHRRWRAHTVVFVPARVQGVGSVRDIVRALQTLNSRGQVDVIIVTRGGGSLEDLQSFNTEEIARAIVASRAPVVAGIGHERDFTIAELVADLRASTPTAAAELIAPDRLQVTLDVRDLARQAADALESMVQQRQERVTGVLDRLQSALRQPLDAVTHLLQEFRTVFIQFAERPVRARLVITNFQQHLHQKIRQVLSEHSLALAAQQQTLTAFNPKAVLDRGYSMTFDEQGHIVDDAKSLHSGLRLQTRLAKGEVTSEVV